MALVAGLEDRAHDGRVVQLLRLVDLVSARVAAGVVVEQILVIVADRPDDIPLHDLHVVNVVQQPEPLRVDRLAKLHAPVRAVAHVILMVHAAVEQLHHDVHLVLLGNGEDTLQAGGAILQACLVVHAGAVAGETDQVFQAGVGHLLDSLLVNLNQCVVVLKPVERPADAAYARFAILQRAGGEADDRAAQTVLAHGWEVRRVKQFDRLHAEAGRLGRELVQPDATVAPLADRVADVALELVIALGRLAKRGSREGGTHGSGAACDCL